jgi:ubiquinone biosynthesis protein
MNVLRFIHRLLYIQFVLVRNGVDDVLTQHPRLWLFRIFVYINPFYWFARKQARAVAIRRSMEERAGSNFC